MTWRTMTYSGWGRALTATGDISRPERVRALKEVSAEGPALGNRRSYGDACLHDAGRAVDMTRLNRVVDFNSKTGLVKVEAGVQLGDLLRLFAPRGWVPAVLPGTGYATVGGAIAMDVHGKNHRHEGTFGQHVTQITLLQKGKRVVAKAGSDLFRATLGGLGQTGLIQSATLQMTPCLGTAVSLREKRITTLDAHLEALETSTAPYAVGWVDATATGKSVGRGILEEAQIINLPAPHPKRGRVIPMNAPHFALSSPIVKAFNALYLRRVPRKGRSRTQDLESFFFPLDKLQDWNRLYGKRGFHQFQCVVPVAQAAVLRDMLQDVGTSGLASPLVVLKRLGAGRAGMMSFPMEGYTLAIDFPARAEAKDLITRLHDRTADAGGRIYFAKDAQLSPAFVDQMYPERADWAAQAALADPAGALQTDLVKRLQLRGDA